MAEKRFLIVVDMQIDFISGSLGTPEAQAIVPAAVSRIRACRDRGDILIATLDTHEEDYLNTAEGRKLPVTHCVRNTPGWEMDPRIREALGEDCVFVEKPTFGSVRLPGIIRDRVREGDSVSFLVIGLCTDICVVSNVLLLKAHFPEADIAVAPECCAGVTPEKHLAALETMASCQIDCV